MLYHKHQTDMRKSNRNAERMCNFSGIPQSSSSGPGSGTQLRHQPENERENQTHKPIVTDQLILHQFEPARLLPMTLFPCPCSRYELGLCTSVVWARMCIANDQVIWHRGTCKTHTRYVDIESLGRPAYQDFQNTACDQREDFWTPGNSKRSHNADDGGQEGSEISSQAPTSCAGTH